MSLDFSPDGRWLASGSSNGLVLWSSSGGMPKILDSEEANRTFVRYAPDSEHVVSADYRNRVVQVWSVPDGQLVRTIPFEGPMDYRLADNPERLFTFVRQDSRTRVEAWPLTGGEPVRYGDLESNVHEYSRYGFSWLFNLDPAGTRVVYAHHPSEDQSQGKQKEFHLVRLGERENPPPVLVARHQEAVSRAAFHPDGRHLATADEAGEVRLWDLEAGPASPERILHQPSPQVVRNLRFDATGSRLASATWSRYAALWDLEGPPGADPLLLRRGETWWMLDAAFHPEGGWLATASHLGVALWPTTGRYPLQLNGHRGAIRAVAFLPEDGGLVSASIDGTVRLWPLSSAAGRGSRVLLRVEDWLTTIAVDRSGRQVLVRSAGGSVWLVPLEETPPRRLAGFEGARGLAVAGNLAAAMVEHRGDRILRVWNLETDEYRDLEPPDEIWGVDFSPDNGLISVGPAGLVSWDLEEGSFETFLELGDLVDLGRGMVDLTPDYRYLLAGNHGDSGEAVVIDMEEGIVHRLDSHGEGRCGQLDPGGRFVVTKPCAGSGTLQVGTVGGGPPHPLVGEDPVSAFAISPDGQWIASLAGDDSHSILLWPVPDLSREPLHLLPHEELLTKLRTLTNLRVVPDPEAETGWSWELDPFPGWEEMPTW
jgi:WD40 repeat protein